MIRIIAGACMLLTPPAILIGVMLASFGPRITLVALAIAAAAVGLIVGGIKLIGSGLDQR